MSEDQSESLALFSKPVSTYTEEEGITPATDQISRSPPHELNHTRNGTNSSPSQNQIEGNGMEVEESEESFDEILCNVHDKAMMVVGFGRLQCLLLLVLGLGIMGHGIQLHMVFYILPGATKDFCLTEEMKALIGGIVLAGMMLGALIWGIMADKGGRKCLLLSALSVNITFGFISALVPAYWSVVLCTFCASFGIGGTLPIIMPYYSEFCAVSGRGWRMGLLLIFLAAGGLYVTSIAWMVIPAQDLWLSMYEKGGFHGWRLLMLLSLIPVFLSIFGLLFMPESPRFLLQVGKDMDALAIYRKVYLCNHMEAGAEYELPEIELPNRKRVTDQGDDQMAPGLLQSSAQAIVKFWKGIFQLFATPLISHTLILSIIWFINAFGYHGLSIWCPQYISRLDDRAYSAKARRNFNTTILGNDYSGIMDNFYFETVIFKDVTFHDIVLKRVIFQSCFLDGCDFQNVAAEKTFFKDSIIKNTLFNDTNFYKSKFHETTLINSSFLNTKDECNLDVHVISSSSHVFLQNFLSHLALVVIAVLVAFLIHKTGRVRVAAGFLFMSAISVFFIWLAYVDVTVISINAIFNCFLSAASGALFIVSTEVFPTQLRCTGMGFLTCLSLTAAIIGNATYNSMDGITKSVPILLTAILLGTVGILSLKLPETHDTRL